MDVGHSQSVDKSTDFSGETVKSKNNILYTGVGGGAAFFLSDNFALETMLLYDLERQRNTDKDGKYLTLSFILKFGFTFFFSSVLQE